MNRRLAIITTLISILSIFLLTAIAGAQERQRRVDDPDDEEDLNRELWEFAKKTPYDEILSYVTAAQRQSKATQTAEVELPNGWRIAPAGTQVEVARLPYEAVPFAGKIVVLGTGYYYHEPQEVSVVDAESGQVVKTIRLQSLFPSAQVGLDGDLYISGGFDEKVFRLDKQFNAVREYKVGGHAGGLAALDAKHLAVGYMATRNAEGNYVGGKLAILNTETGNVEREVAVGYFPYAVRYINGSLYVTLLGEDKLLVYSADLKLLKSIAVGRTPQEMCTDGKSLYVVNTGSDSLSVVNTRSNRITSTIALAAKETRFGTTPSSCALDSSRLYVTLAGTNAVAVLDRRTNKQVALVPTGWYPTKVLVNDKQLLVLSAKGIHARRPNPKGPQAGGPSRVGDYVLTLLKGTLSIISKDEVQKNAAAWTKQVNAGSPIYGPREGFKLPIRYIFYIIKENRTYDQVLGDLDRGNGDAKLTIFGESISPVQHQLAREFVTLDNLFVNGEMSITGHSFTTSGYASPFLEWFGNMTYSQRWKGNRNGGIPAAMSPSYLWDVMDEQGIDYRIYGEELFLFTRAYKIISETQGAESELTHKFYEKMMVATAAGDRGSEFNDVTQPFYGQVNTREDLDKLLGNPQFASAISQYLTGDDSFARAVQKDEHLRRQFADLLYHYPFNFRSWDLKYSDLDRVRDWQQDFEAQLKLGKVAQLHYIWLPNDHTDGASTKILDPFQFIAQNDAALGRIVEIISHSPVWRESLILVEEDDAQNGPDHVDATRTTAFAAGPYVKRGAVVSDRYDQLSMLRTIEILLGLKSLNLGEQLAVPMFGIFADQPDYQPFVPTAPSSRLAPADLERDRQLAGH